jgi:hypothetical protein
MIAGEEREKTGWRWYAWPSLRADRARMGEQMYSKNVALLGILWRRRKVVVALPD